LSMNPTEVLSFRTVDQARDINPCSSNSQLLRCTFMNFLIEVPSTQFLVFRNPIRLQFTFGRHGWEDSYFRPQLRYWEAYHEEWRPAAASCPPGQAYEHWNDLHRIYAVSLCHLSQFAVFEYFAPPPQTTTVQPHEQPESYNDPVFFVILTGCMVAVLSFCVILYVVRTRLSLSSACSQTTFEELGIRPVTERLPSRRHASIAGVVEKNRQDDALELLAALPCPNQSCEKVQPLGREVSPLDASAPCEA